MQRRRITRQVHKVPPCDICGHVGFGEVIVTCSKCKVNREHVYCMRINLMEVPDYWLCERCQSNNGSTSQCKVKQDSGLQVSKRPQFARRGPTGKVKYLHEDEVIKLSSCKFSMKSTPLSSTSPLTSNANPRSSAFSMTRRGRVASRSVFKKIPSLNLKPNPCISAMPHGKFPRNGVQKNPMTGQHTAPSVGPTKEHGLVSERQLGAQIPDRKVQNLHLRIEKPTKGSPCKDLSATKSVPVAVSDIAKYNGFTMEKSKIQTFAESFHPYYKYFPSSIRAWSGQFQIRQEAVSGEVYDGFEAQPPCAVNRKAYNLSNKIPSVLNLESLPALNILTDVFPNYSPTLQDIALYFFPSDNNERSRKNLDNLLKFMNNENSMLRGLINGVELLVFTSHKLSEDSRGTIAAVHEGYFLWGVFRSKKSDSADERLPPDMDPVDIDMDIDMMGGNDVVMDPVDVDMDIDMMGGSDVVGRIDYVINDNLKSPLPLEGTPLQSTSSKKVEEKTLTSSSNLNGGDKSISSEDLRKKIKLENSSDPSSGSLVKKYRKVLDILDVPPGFQPHGHGAVKPSNARR